MIKVFIYNYNYILVHIYALSVWIKLCIFKPLQKHTGSTSTGYIVKYESNDVFSDREKSVCNLSPKPKFQFDCHYQ